MTAQRWVEAIWVTLLAIGILRIAWLYWKDEKKRKRSERYKKDFRAGKVHLAPVRQGDCAVVRDLRHRRLRLRHAHPVQDRPRPRRAAGGDSGLLRRGAAAAVPENGPERDQEKKG